MSSSPEPASYGALAGDAYRSLVTAAEAINTDAIAYLRTLVGIFSKPFTPFERSAAAIGATLDVFEANNRHGAELARDFADIVSSAHETYVAGLRNLAEISVSNIEFARAAATRNAPISLPLPSVN